MEKLFNIENGYITISGLITEVVPEPEVEPTFNSETDLLFPFIEGNIIGVVRDAPQDETLLGDGIRIIQINTYTGAGTTVFIKDTWIDVDLTGYVPPDTKAVFLAGRLIITQNSEPSITDLQIAYRRDDTVVDNMNYLGQALEAPPGRGVRIPHSTWVPVKDMKFQMKWHSSTNWIVGNNTLATYGINMNLVAYMR